MKINVILRKKKCRVKIYFTISFLLLPIPVQATKTHKSRQSGSHKSCYISQLTTPPTDGFSRQTYGYLSKRLRYKAVLPGRGSVSGAFLQHCHLG